MRIMNYIITFKVGFISTNKLLSIFINLLDGLLDRIHRLKPDYIFEFGHWSFNK